MDLQLIIPRLFVEMYLAVLMLQKRIWLIKFQYVFNMYSVVTRSFMHALVHDWNLKIKIHVCVNTVCNGKIQSLQSKANTV